MGKPTQRVLSAAVAIPLVLLAIFKLPSHWFFVLLLVVVEIQVYEFVRVSRAWAPHAPLEALLILVPPAALLLGPASLWLSPVQVPWEYMLVLAMTLTVGVGCLALFGRTPVEESMSALGVFSFGMAYFALPVASLHYMHRLDPWILLLLLLIVWAGDSAAWIVGKRWGRHKLAPVVSPKKTWEGALAAFVAALVVAALWSYFRLGEVRLTVLGLSAVASIGGQIGDLVESMLKRGAGIKDSGKFLPGHGGMLDRMDAVMFAAPVMLVGLWQVGYDTVIP